ncbi:hypothetical protein Patl1_19258 [Pistacia atlantica]|uniref:Uncharacterized protein n=1 Tax=Pistacia atlantica TaxID=434234 RepID=A0ACC1C1P3_9ROSI|nr:hypothetical protein Patl1_19258 [Pistacia atlantica]
MAMDSLVSIQGGISRGNCLSTQMETSAETGKIISIYLALAEMSSLPSGWEINVVFNFFIFNQLQDKYCIVQD